MIKFRQNNSTNFPFIILLVTVYHFIGTVYGFPDEKKGLSLINPDYSKGFKLNLNARQYGSSSVHQEKEIIDGDPVIKLRVDNPPEFPYQFQIKAKNTQSITTGSHSQIKFFGRLLSSDMKKGLIEVLVEKTSGSKKKILRYFIELSKEWSEHTIPFKFKKTHSRGDIRICIRAGYFKQTLELKKISVKVFPTDQIDTYEFYKPLFTYKNNNPKWKKTSIEKIREIRKGPIEVNVVGNDNQTFSGLSVHFGMVKHHFRFGGIVDAGWVTGKESNNQTYREKVLELFPYSGFESDLKWPQLENDTKYKTTLSAIHWLNENQINLRGHCLLWPSWNKMPKDIKKHSDNEPYLKNRILEHVEKTVRKHYPIILEWDGINEATLRTDINSILGDNIYGEMFKVVKYINKEIKFIVNDNGLLNHGGLDLFKMNKFLSNLESWEKTGMKYDGIGLQSHFQYQITSPDLIHKQLNTLAQYTNHLLITEFDIDIPDDNLMAEYMSDYLHSVFSHPAVDGIYLWGFWDGRHWRDNAPIFYQDWTLKPSGIVWKHLVYNEWWTNESVVTDITGKARVDAFFGDYIISMNYNGETYSETISHTGDSNIVIQLNERDESK